MIKIRYWDLSLQNIRIEYDAAKQEIELLQDEAGSKISSQPESSTETVKENRKSKSPAPSDDMVMADDDELSDEDELFNKMLKTETSARKIVGKENSNSSKECFIFTENNKCWKKQLFLHNNEQIFQNMNFYFWKFLELKAFSRKFFWIKKFFSVTKIFRVKYFEILWG